MAKATHGTPGKKERKEVKFYKGNETPALLKTRAREHHGEPQPGQT